MFLAGRLADRLNVRAVLAGGPIVSAAGMRLMYVITTPWQMFGSYGVVFAAGNGVASITPVSLMVARAFPEQGRSRQRRRQRRLERGQLVIVAAFTVVLARFGWRHVFLWGGTPTWCCCRSCCFPFPPAATGSPAGAAAGKAARGIALASRCGRRHGRASSGC